MDRRIGASSAVGRADLLRALLAARATKGSQPEGRLAELFGFDFTPSGSSDTGEVQTHPQPGPEPTEAPPPPAPEPAELPRMRFWRAESLLVKPALEIEKGRQVPAAIREASDVFLSEIETEGDPPEGKPLLAWHRLWPFLRSRLTSQLPSRDPDLSRIIRSFARGRAVTRLPRKPRRSWHPRVHVWLDRRKELAPFWDDYDNLLTRLTRLRGRWGLDVSQLEIDDTSARRARSGSGFYRDDYPVRAGREGRGWSPLALPASGDLVLVLGDLGQLAGRTEEWTSLGRKLRGRSIAPWALCPAPRDRWSPAVSGTWNVAVWDRGQRLPLRGEGQGPLHPGEEHEVAPARRARVKRLMTLASPAIRVERGLLRDLRFLLSGHEADAGTEYDVFQAQDTRGEILGITIQEDAAKALRGDFGRLPPLLQRKVVGEIRRHHAYCEHLFGHMEVLGLSDALGDAYNELEAAGVIAAGALTEAERFWKGVVKVLLERRGASQEESQFGFRDWRRLGGLALNSDEQQAIWALANPDHSGPLPASVKPETLEWVQPARGLPASHLLGIGREGARGLERAQLGSRMATDIKVSWNAVAALWAGFDSNFPLGVVESAQEHVSVRAVPESEGASTGGAWRRVPWNGWSDSPGELLKTATRIEVVTERQSLVLSSMERPYWAERMWYDREGLAASLGGRDKPIVLRWMPPVAVGENLTGRDGLIPGVWAVSTSPSWARGITVDEYGVVARMYVAEAEFVLRWIPPGTFTMGTPDGEEPADDDERPAHDVTITNGFWIGETPVTQGQWHLVVEGSRRQPVSKERHELNPRPSHFRGHGNLPVESVSWDDCIEFCERLTTLASAGPRFSLPSEAEWEYACRAGTTAALYTGPVTILGTNHAPELDAIAWYAGNSGLELAVENPADSSDWPEKQFAHPRAGTHLVRRKKANPWGLYDTIGNVWEWCRDDRRAYGALPTIDPLGLTAGADRVVRGGSWSDVALWCRAAFRGQDHRAVRGDGLGFRLFAGQVKEAEPQEQAPKASASRRGSAAAERKKARKKS